MTLSAAVPPNETVLAALYPLPLIVTTVLPAVGPKVGLMPLTVGGLYVKTSPGTEGLICE